MNTTLYTLGYHIRLAVRRKDYVAALMYLRLARRAGYAGVRA